MVVLQSNVKVFWGPNFKTYDCICKGADYLSSQIEFCPTKPSTLTAEK